MFTALCETQTFRLRLNKEKDMEDMEDVLDGSDIIEFAPYTSVTFEDVRCFVRHPLGYILGTESLGTRLVVGETYWHWPSPLITEIEDFIF